ncbi:MAG: helix-turn-helix domain-containing protein [Actinomycetota bacterium]
MQEMHEAAGKAPPRPALLTTRDVQQIIRVDKSTIYRMAETGRIPAVKVGRQWRFPADRLQEWLQSGPAAVGSPGQENPPANGSRRLAPGALHAVADYLAAATGTMVVVTDITGRPLADPANPCGLFRAVHAYPGVMERCVLGWQELAGELEFEPRWRPTPLGFLCARSLFRVGDRLEGMVLAGGVAPAGWPPPAGEIERLAANLGVPAAVISSHLGEVYPLGPEELARVLCLLPPTAVLVSRLVEAGAVGRVVSPAAIDSSQRSET